MHSFVSGILSLLLSPADWIVVLILGSYFLKKLPLKKYCKIAAVGIFLLFTNSWLLDWYASKWQPAPHNIATEPTYSCGILLGGFGSPDANDNGYFNSTADRFIQTAKLYKLGKIEHILIAGGNGKNKNKNFDEGKWALNECKSIGIPDSAILFEDKSKNTSDNAINSKILLDSIHLAPPYLLITSACHIPRATLQFKKAGMDVKGYPCNYIAGRAKFDTWGFIPRLDVLQTWNFFLKETAGYIIYKWK